MVGRDRKWSLFLQAVKPSVVHLLINLYKTSNDTACG